MSLSMPTTCMPSAAKCRTASDPINPAEPVTSATLTPWSTSRLEFALEPAQRFPHTGAIRLGPHLGHLAGEDEPQHIGGAVAPVDPALGDPGPLGHRFEPVAPARHRLPERR